MLRVNKENTNSRVATKYQDTLQSGSLVRTTRLSRVGHCRGFEGFGANQGKYMTKERQ